MAVSTTPLTPLQQQFQDIVKPKLEEITIDNEPLDTLTSDRLQEVLLERDIDDILCLKDSYSEDLNLEDKANQVHNILQDIIDSNTPPSAVDELIKQLIEKSVIFKLKSEKRKELTADFQRSFNGLTTKEEIKSTREEIQKTSSFQEVEQQSKQAGSNRYQAKKKQRNTNKITKAEQALQSASKILEDSKSDVKLTDLDKVVELGTSLLNYINEMKTKAEQSRIAAEAEQRRAEQENTQQQSVMA